MIFGKKNRSQEINNHSYENFATLFSSKFAKEYRNWKEIINETRQEKGQESTQGEVEDLNSAFKAIKNFMNSEPIDEIDSALTSQFFAVNSKRIQRIAEQVPDVMTDELSRIADNLAETCTYFADSVIAGNFVMMPGTDLKSSQSYRAYLLGNNLNGKLGWNWEVDDKNKIQKADSYFTQIIGGILTENFDVLNKRVRMRAVINLIHNHFAIWAVILANEWESSNQRLKLK